MTALCLGEQADDRHLMKNWDDMMKTAFVRRPKIGDGCGGRSIAFPTTQHSEKSTGIAFEHLAEYCGVANPDVHKEIKSATI